MKKIIPRGSPSPRIEHGTLIWCEGDTFRFKLIMKLFGGGMRVGSTEGYVFGASFHDMSGKCIKTFEEDSDGSASFTLDFDESTTALFRRGRYTYDVTVTTSEGRRSTVTSGAPVSVL